MFNIGHTMPNVAHMLFVVVVENINVNPITNNEYIMQMNLSDAL